MKNLSLTLKTALRRFLNKKLGMYRPSSYPYLSGDGFRVIANYVYDQFCTFDPSELRHGDIVFVRGNVLREFFDKKNPLIRESYVLISHNEDGLIGPEYAQYIDSSKILHWYAENLFFKHDKVTALPIGIQNFTVGYPENFVHVTQTHRERRNPSKNRILFAFTLVSENVERQAAYDVAHSSPISDWVSLPREEYYSTLADYKFTASPRGNGLDCHRTWEALYMNIVPILLSNVWSEQIAAQGFPVLLIDSWSDISTMTADFLADFYEKNKVGFDTPKLHLSYWYDEFAKHTKHAKQK
jgi:hypothetical protein